MKAIGIYFGPRNVSIIEADGKHITNIIQFPVLKSDTNVLDDKAPEDLKIGQVLKDELKKNPFSLKSVNVVIPGKDCIIRTFHMPVLPEAEMSNAVRFEAKKYIPFKVEDLAADFRVIYDKSSRKNLVLFVGIKKDVLERYNGILAQANFKAESVEYSGFSALRLLQQANIREKDATAVVYADPIEDDEVNFVVVEDGFPLFNRDIILSGYAEEGSVKIEQLALADKVEKLKIEVRVSLDYYLRKFPTKNIKKIIFVAPPEYRTDLEGFARERTLLSRFVELGSLVDKPGVFSLGFYKAYAASLTKTVIPKVKVDLLSVTMKARTTYVKATPGFSLAKLKFQVKFAVWGILMIAGVYAWGVYQQIPVKKALEEAVDSQPRVASIAWTESLDNITAQNGKFIEKLMSIDSQLKKRMLLTKELNIIPQVIPEGVWLREFSYTGTSGNMNVNIAGWAYLDDSNKELEAINLFKTRLSESTEFGAKFKDISITAANQGQLEEKSVTVFTIQCKEAK